MFCCLLNLMISSYAQVWTIQLYWHGDSAMHLELCHAIRTILAFQHNSDYLNFEGHVDVHIPLIQVGEAPLVWSKQVLITIQSSVHIVINNERYV